MLLKKFAETQEVLLLLSFVQGLMRMSEGVEMVEKSIIAYGSVEMGKLERGMIWISLFISLAPMLGFMGTVIGMIEAFDAIAEGW